jgi:hypothetical protein
VTHRNFGWRTDERRGRVWSTTVDASTVAFLLCLKWRRKITNFLSEVGDVFNGLDRVSGKKGWAIGALWAEGGNMVSLEVWAVQEELERCCRIEKLWGPLLKNWFLML